MPSLIETQRAMMHALVSADTRSLDPMICAGPVAAAECLAIYRNTAVNTLVKALRLSHPAVHRLLGADFFDAAARKFLEGCWPGAALLDEFGAVFAGFLCGFEPAAAVPYIGDVARLEWAVHQALHAVDAPPLDLKRLAAVPDAQTRCLRFLPHPSLGLVAVHWPSDVIWRAVIDQDDGALSHLDPQPGPRWLLVQRSRLAGAQVQRITESAWRFAAALCAGKPLQEAIESTPWEPGQPGPEQILGQMLADGGFADVGFIVGRRP